VLLMEHEPVYTMGRSGSADHVPAGVDALRARGAEYVDVDRGGSVTFHGPGQLVAYPIVDVACAFPLAPSAGSGDVIRYIRALESAVIDTVAQLGVVAVARPPYTGAWVGDGAQARKIAAIGVKVAGGVSTHGIALNVSTDLAWFDQIIPCGIAGSGVTSLEREGSVGATVPGVSPVLVGALSRVLQRVVEPPSPALLSLIDAVFEEQLTAA
jgi:lipoyl(octanoyl) transferase